MINKMLIHVDQAANVIKISQARSMPFAEHIEDSGLNRKKTKLVSLRKTRWVERVESLLFLPKHHHYFHLFISLIF